MSTSVQLSPLDRFSSACALTSTCMNRTSSPGARGAASDLQAVGGGSSRLAPAMASCSCPLLPPAPAACRRSFVRPLTCELRSGVRTPQLWTTRAQASLDSSSSSDSDQETKRTEGHGGGYVDDLCGYAGSARHPLADLAETMENRPGAASCHDSTTSRRRMEDEGTGETKVSAIASGLATSMVVVLAAAALLVSSPNEAMAARSGGRVGGSAFRSAPRSGPSTRAYSSSPRRAPPIYGGGYGGGFLPFGGYGYSPFGYGFGPAIGIQGGGGGLFQFMFIIFVVNFIFNSIRNLTDRDDDED